MTVQLAINDTNITLIQFNILTFNNYEQKIIAILVLDNIGNCRLLER